MFSIFKLFKFVKESYGISDQKIWQKYTSNPEFPYLVSFPRTGSHWLRNVMELYFEKPSLTRVFLYSFFLSTKALGLITLVKTHEGPQKT